MLQRMTVEKLDFLRAVQGQEVIFGLTAETIFVFTKKFSIFETRKGININSFSRHFEQTVVYFDISTVLSLQKSMPYICQNIG